MEIIGCRDQALADSSWIKPSSSEGILSAIAPHLRGIGLSLYMQGFNPRKYPVK